MGNDKYIGLLKEDFSQCHEWMRHYDSSFMTMINYLYAGYIALITASYYLYKNNSDKPNMAITSLLLFGTIVGSIFLVWLFKNRIYFVRVTRFVNETRNAYISQKPLGILNKAGMKTELDQPSYANLFSNHSIFMYFTALCNSVILLLAILSFNHCGDKYPVKSGITVSILYFSLCIGLIIWRAHAKEIKEKR